MHADDRTLRAAFVRHPAPRLRPTLGGWIFVPLGPDEAAVAVWHRDEPLLPNGDDPLRAEHLARSTRRGIAGVELLVRGVVLAGDGAALVLRGWHRAERVGGDAQFT